MAAARLGPHHSRANSQSLDYAANHPSSDDGYDYNIIDDAPEAEPTKPREVAGTEPRHTLTSPSTLRKSDDPDNVFTETMPRIYQRHAGGRRAKIPTDLDVDLEKGINGGTSATSDTEKARKAVPELSNINLRWTMPEIDGRRVLQLNYDKADSEAPEPYLRGRRVRWHHFKQDIPRLGAFEELVDEYQSQSVSKGQRGLTRRLLKRVRNLTEREFVGGKFLTPVALRYDNQDVSKFTVDTTCTFFSYPYFLVAKPELRKYFDRGDTRHPPRTLLQSHYRLNKTVDRDEDQCISLLGHGIMESSMNPLHRSQRFLSSRAIDHLVFVPQLWGIIDGTDTLISSGPIHKDVLQSPAINITKSVPRPLGHTLSLIRILFKYQNRQEDLIYPVIQCDSWFGLLNKQQQILEFLGTGSDKPRPMEYRFWLDQGRPITISNWALLLREFQSSEIVDIWMNKYTPKIDVHSVEGYRTTVRQPTFSTIDSDIENGSIHVPVISSFFAWDILDEFGETETDKISLSDRVDRFLKAIYSGVAAEAQIQVERKTENHVQQYLQTINEDRLASELGQHFRLLFLLYVPFGEQSASLPIGMYWGAVFEIIQTFHEKPFLRSTLERYTRMVSIFVFQAQRLHQGVYCSRLVQDDTTNEWRTQDAVANGAILLSVIVDALGAILRMLVETVKSLRDTDEEANDIMGPAWKISEHGKDACDLLKEARDQLIREAHGRDKNGDVGPVLTPEAITIAQLERLASGVMHSGTLDIIHLYEECLEHLLCLAPDISHSKLTKHIFPGAQSQI